MSIHGIALRRFVGGREPEWFHRDEPERSTAAGFVAQQLATAGDLEGVDLARPLSISASPGSGRIRLEYKLPSTGAAPSDSDVAGQLARLLFTWGEITAIDVLFTGGAAEWATAHRFTVTAGAQTE